MNYGYSRIQPMNTKTSYEEFDVVDFSIQIPEGRSLLLGSVRLEGEVEVSATGGITLNQTTNVNTIPANTLDIKIDSDAGAHGFIEQVSTSFSGPSFSGLGESLGDYGRYVKMSSVAMTRSNGDNNNSSNVCELKAVNDEATNNILKGELVATDPALSSGVALRNNPDFSIKLRNCLNGGRGELPARKSGEIMISISLARNFAALYGINNGAAISYSLKDLRLTYNHVPDSGSNDPVVMRRKLNVKQSLTSANSSINVNVPAVCDSFSASFQVQSQENTPKNNNYTLHTPPALTQVQYLYNNSNSSLISYVIRSIPELIDNAIDSFVDADKNSLSTARLANLNGFMLGQNLDDEVNFMKNKLTVEIDSDISNLTPLVMYMYFHSTISL